MGEVKIFDSLEFEKKEMDKKIGEKVKVFCVVKGIKRSELAEVIGVSCTTMTFKLSGERPFLAHELLLIAKKYDKSVDEILK